MIFLSPDIERVDKFVSIGSYKRYAILECPVTITYSSFERFTGI